MVSFRIPAIRLVSVFLTLAIPAAVVVVPTHALAAPQVDSVASALPPRSVKHTEQYWSWFAPRNWIGSSGAYGINISSPDGSMNLDYGFSSVLCATATTEAGSVTAYFAAQGSELRRSLNSQWNRVRMAASRIRQLPVSGYGASYYRQVLEFTGRAQGEGLRGEAVFDYSLASGPTYCFARNQARVAPQQGYRQSIRQLRSIQDALAYFGPGVPSGGGNTDPDQ